MSRSFEVRASGLIIAAVILAGPVAQALVGDYTYFGFTAAALPIFWKARASAAARQIAPLQTPTLFLDFDPDQGTARGDKPS